MFFQSYRNKVAANQRVIMYFEYTTLLCKTIFFLFYETSPHVSQFTTQKIGEKTGFNVSKLSD